MQLRNGLPHYAAGRIVQGFGRGSKDLGIPTANYPLDVVKNLPAEIETGIYFGWASVDGGIVHKMVMSIGWNPYFENKEKSMETYIMHEYDGDLYGSMLKVCICGFIRPEKNFDTVEALIAEIRADIEHAERILAEGSEFDALRKTDFFSKVSVVNGDEGTNGV